MKTKIGRERQDLLESKYNRSKENDVEIQGEITGAIYRNGPVASRGSTDTFFCGVYVLFLASLLAISIIGLIDGDIRYLYAGYDSDDNACGVGSLSDYPYLYFASPDTNISMTVCVSACPSSSDSTLDCYINSVITNCSTSEVYTSIDYLGVACVPTDATLYSDISGYLSQGYWENFIDIFVDNWCLYLTALGFSYCLATFYLLLMLFFPKCVAWTYIVSSITTMLIGASLFMILYANPSLLLSKSTTVISDELKLAISIILFVLSGLAIVYVFCKIKKIAGAITFMETTSLFVKQVWSSMFLPFGYLIIISLYIVYALYFTLLFFTIGEVNKNGSTSPFGLMYPDTEGWIFLILHAVGTLINLSFITCSYIFILNSACTYWYYSTPIMTAAQEKEKMDEEKKDTKKDKEPAKEDEAIKDGKIEEKNVEESKKKKKTTVTPVSPVRKITTIYPILEASKIYWSFHIGSIFVGSILITLFSWFNYLFSNIYNKIAQWRDYAESKSCVHILLTGILSLFYFYEKFLRYISRNAFVQMTITGNNFYTSSKDAFYLVQRNNNAYSSIKGLGDFITFLGELYIILITTIIFFIGMIEYYEEDLEISLEVSAVVFFIAFVSSDFTMMLFSATDEAILLDYLLDVEIEVNNYGKSNPYHAPAPLKKFLEDPQHQKDLNS